MLSSLTLRVVDAPGVDTTVVVAAVEMLVFCVPNAPTPVGDDVAASKNEAWTSIVAAADVTTRMRLEVEVSSMGYEAGVIDRVMAPIAAVYVSPAVYAFAVIVPDILNVPADEAFQIEKWVASCEPAMFVHCT